MWAKQAEELVSAFPAILVVTAAWATKALEVARHLEVEAVGLRPVF